MNPIASAGQVQFVAEDLQLQALHLAIHSMLRTVDFHGNDSRATPAARHRVPSAKDLIAAQRGPFPYKLVQKRLHPAKRIHPPAMQQRLVHIVGKDD